MRTRAFTTTLPVMAAGALLLAACTGDPSMVTSANATSPATGGAPAQPTMIAAGLEVVPESYWTAPLTEGDLTRVRVGGCGDDTACPTFTALTGEAVPAGPTAPILEDGVACPDGATPTAATEPVTTDATVARERAQLTVFQVTCTDASGEVTSTVEQRQWRAEGPAGPVVVVDRWSFDGLPRALAEATWAG